MIEALHGVLRLVAEPAHVLKVVLEQAVAETGAERGVFVEVEDQGRLEYRVLHGFAPGQLEGDAGRFSKSLFARVLESGEDVRLESATDDPTLMDAASVREMRRSAVLCMPIRSDGAIRAIVHLEHPSRGHFTEEHRARARALLDVAGPVLAALRAGRHVIGERDRLRSETEVSRRQLASDWSFGRFIGRSPAVRKLETEVRDVAATSFPVLLRGETGTGKSILARIIHYASPRAAQPLVTVFCPSLERGMVESELFGHRRGAFTGAVLDQIGKVQAAEGGTLFLDEIGELSPDIQPKLLRLLQERTYERLGDPTERRADVRVIAATNRDLEREVAQGRFRRDLFERLNYLPVRVPALSERVEDIPLLLRHALDQIDTGRWIDVTPEAERALRELDFEWPGNVRHVEQLAARLTLGGSSPATAERVLALLDRGGKELLDGSAPDLSAGLPSLMEDAERTWLDRALKLHPDLTRAELAQRLKISESALYKKLRQYGLVQG
jgi:transcriptional regulator with GAF, ATPase, and Fis domain